jgi:hypothetical protein
MFTYAKRVPKDSKTQYGIVFDFQVTKINSLLLKLLTSLNQTAQ